MREKEHKQSLTAYGTGTATDADRFVSACRETICREMPSLLDELFSRLEIALYDLVDKSDSSKLDAAYFYAKRVFRQRRGEISALFLENLREQEEGGSAVQSSQGSASASGKPDAQGGKPVEGAELEESLAVKNLISKAESRYQTQLIELRRHLAALRGQEHVESDSDPIGPHHICNAFRQALRPAQDIELSIKLVAFKFFDKQVIDQLGRVYELCREHIDDQEPAADTRPAPVVPGASEQRKHEIASHRKTGTGERESGLDPAPSWPTSGQDRSVDFRDIRRLLGWRRHADSPDGGQVVLDTDELVSALSRLQETEGSDADPWELRRRLRDYLRLGGTGASGRALARMDEDTLDLVFLLFEHVLQGNQIPDPLKVLIGRLQIPTLKAALVDKSFFEDKHHPARRLLNNLALVAVGWNDDGERSPDSVYGHIDSLVDRIAGSDERDPVVFAELNAALCDFLAREQERAQSEELRALQDLELRERRHSARQLVKMAINQRLRDSGPVPECISALIHDGWQQVLLAAYLRDGASGAEWNKAMRTMDRLVWSVRPKVAYEDRRELLRTIPELLRTLRQSLADVSFDQRQLARWFKELQALHITALRSAGPPGLAQDGGEARPDIRSSEKITGGMVEHTDAPERRGAGARRLELAGLRQGSWIEVRRDDGTLIRVKLAWRSPQSGVYLFVDRHGRNVMELTADDILKLKQKGTMTVLGDTPIVDQAMQELIQTLKSNRGP